MITASDSDDETTRPNRAKQAEMKLKGRQPNHQTTEHGDPTAADQNAVAGGTKGGEHGVNKGPFTSPAKVATTSTTADQITAASATKGGEQVANESVEARVGPFASPPQAKDAVHAEMRGDHSETAVRGEVRKHGPFTTPKANKAPESESSHTTDTDGVPTQAHTEAAKWVRLLGSHGTKSKWVLAMTATVDDNPPLGSV